MKCKLFVIWDTTIANFYHKIYRQNGLRYHSGGEKCYFEFLKDMQKLSQDVLKNNTESTILKKLKEISKYDKTLAKVLDKYNYMTITKA